MGLPCHLTDGDHIDSYLHSDFFRYSLPIIQHIIELSYKPRWIFIVNESDGICLWIGAYHHNPQAGLGQPCKKWTSWKGHTLYTLFRKNIEYMLSFVMVGFLIDCIYNQSVRLNFTSRFWVEAVQSSKGKTLNTCGKWSSLPQKFIRVYQMLE